MNDDDWSGLNRRTENTLEDEQAFRRKELRRKKDKQNIITFYIMLGILWIAIMAMIGTPVLHYMGVF